MPISAINLYHSLFIKNNNSVNSNKLAIITLTVTMTGIIKVKSNYLVLGIPRMWKICTLIGVIFCMLNCFFDLCSSVGDKNENGEYQISRVIRQVIFEDRARGIQVRPGVNIGTFRESQDPFRQSAGISFPGQQQQPPQPFQRPPPNIVQRRPQHFGQRPSNQGCNCVHIASCSAASRQTNFNGCSLLNGALGVCCPSNDGVPPWGGITRLFTNNVQSVNIPPVSSSQINDACNKGIGSVDQINAVEQSLMRSNNVLKRGDPARGHLKFFQVTPTARVSHKGAMAIAKASEAMKRDFRLTDEQSCVGLRQFTARNTILRGNCPEPPRCIDRLKYRTIDGTCNNLKKPLWGKSETAFQRILPAKYSDGIRAPRNRAVSGRPLPNERKISNTVLIDLDNPDPQFTLSIMQWGQFVDHDLTHAPFASFDNNEGKECCRNGQVVQPQLLEDCWPIEIPSDDEFYSRRGQRCMNFVRSMLAEDDECSFGCAEQMNQITHWLDGSNIYGSTEEEAHQIRDFNTGLLRVSRGNSLPFQTRRSHDCEASNGASCFAAGDSRVNEQPGLTAIHTIWHREHNRVANALRSMNPQWSSEAVYQEARRIVVAEYQHIVYNEWLPVIVGEPFMKSFDIEPRREGYSLDYNPNVNPNMNNEFATAAFRFGHTLVQGTMRLFSRIGRQSTLRLKDHFNSPHLFQTDPEMVDKFARTFTKQNIQQFDSFITKELTNHLFETRETDFGMDLMSLNIHRGRDHAIVPYNDMRVICGLPRARNFQDLTDQIPQDTVQRLASVYENVDDIDYFVGGISERPVAGGLLGWTFLCAVGDQFARVKKGDRYFYDIGGQPGSFSLPQLNEIRKASWARILCDNSNMDSVQPLAFLLPGGLNQEASCNSPTIPRINLQLWQGERAQA